MKSQNYMTRALRSSDPRFARVLGKLGYTAAEAGDPLDHDRDGRKGGSPKAAASDELDAARAEYQRIVGKRPFNGWDLATLREKIAGAGNADG